MTLSEEIISAKGVTKVYSDNGVPVPALRGVDLTIRRGEFTALVGPSGSGKTTLLNIISGLDVPSEGEVWLNGKLLSGMSGRELSDFRRDSIGFIFQAYNLIPVLTVEENIEYVMLLQEVPRQERRHRVSYPPDQSRQNAFHHRHQWLQLLPGFHLRRHGGLHPGFG